MRRPRPDGGQIYKLDDSKANNSTGQKLSETEPITFKVLSKTESALIPTHLEIPFLQDRMTIIIKAKVAFLVQLKQVFEVDTLH